MRKRAEHKCINKEKVVSVMMIITIAVNVFLFAGKLIAGILSSSYALISDAANSGSDILSTVIIFIGVRISIKKADKNHQYGHERFECVAGIILSIIIFITGFELLMTAVRGESDVAPSMLAIYATCIVIIIKIGMFFATLFSFKATHSSSLKAIMIDHMSDIIASTGGVVGIAIALNGYPIFDRIASGVICIFIIATAIKIFSDAIRKMTDEAADKAITEKIENIIFSDNGVVAIDKLRTRKFGDRLYIEVEISVLRDLSLIEAHDIAERIHDKIEENEPCIKHCTVHVNPALIDEDGSTSEAGR